MVEFKAYFTKQIKDIESEKSDLMKKFKQIQTEHGLLSKELEISNQVNTEKNLVQSKLNSRIKQIEEQMINMTSNYRSKLEKWKFYFLSSHQGNRSAYRSQGKRHKFCERDPSPGRQYVFRDSPIIHNA